MMSQRERFFYNNKIYLENLPVKLHTYLYLIDLMNKKQISLYKSDNSELHLTLQENNQTALLPSSVTITMISSRADKLSTKKYEYTFCSKNVAEWCEVDEQGKETSDNNPSAYLIAEQPLLKEQTDACVQTIVQEIKKFKPDVQKSNEDDACRCSLF